MHQHSASGSEACWAQASPAQVPCGKWASFNQWIQEDQPSCYQPYKSIRPLYTALYVLRVTTAKDN